MTKESLITDLQRVFQTSSVAPHRCLNCTGWDHFEFECTTPKDYFTKEEVQEILRAERIEAREHLRKLREEATKAAQVVESIVLPDPGPNIHSDETTEEEGASTDLNLPPPPLEEDVKKDPFEPSSAESPSNVINESCIESNFSAPIRGFIKQIPRAFPYNQSEHSFGHVIDKVKPIDNLVVEKPDILICNVENTPVINDLIVVSGKPNHYSLELGCASFCGSIKGEKRASTWSLNAELSSNIVSSTILCHPLLDYAKVLESLEKVIARMIGHSELPDLRLLLYDDMSSSYAMFLDCPPSCDLGMKEVDSRLLLYDFEVASGLLSGHHHMHWNGYRLLPSSCCVSSDE
jgi:hypothetical protein